MDFPPKLSKRPRNCCLLETYCLVITEENFRSFWSNLRLVLLTRHFGGVKNSETSQVCHIKEDGSNYLGKLTNKPFFLTKAWKT